MRSFLVALFLVACGAPPSNLPAGSVIRYGVNHREGSTSLRVHAGGESIYGEDDHTEARSKEFKAMLSESDLQTFVRTLTDNNFCSLRSSRDKGVPDEARPALAVKLGGIDCRVEMWDNEIDDEPRARASFKAVYELIRIIRAGE